MLYFTFHLLNSSGYIYVHLCSVLAYLTVISIYQTCVIYTSVSNCNSGPYVTTNSIPLSWMWNLLGAISMGGSISFFFLQMVIVFINGQNLQKNRERILNMQGEEYYRWIISASSDKAEKPKDPCAYNAHWRTLKNRWKQMKVIS